MLGILLVSAVCHVLSLLQEEEEEFRMVEVVDYSIQDTEQGKIIGECSKGGRADCVGLEAWTKELC